MFVLTKRNGRRYERIPGTPLFVDFDTAKYFGSAYMRQFPIEFRDEREAIHVLRAPPAAAKLTPEG